MNHMVLSCLDEKAKNTKASSSHRGSPHNNSYTLTRHTDSECDTTGGALSFSDAADLLGFSHSLTTVSSFSWSGAENKTETHE